MDALIHIKNADTSMISALKAMLKTRPELEFSFKKLDKSPKVPNDETLKAMKECLKLEKDIQKGKKKPYKSWKDAQNALLKD